VAPGVRERLYENKQSKQKFHTERFKFDKLSEIEIIEQYEVRISN
jgi:hypothetical protein